jgi:hypothetical protein
MLTSGLVLGACGDDGMGTPMEDDGGTMDDDAAVPDDAGGGSDDAGEMNGDDAGTGPGFQFRDEGPDAYTRVDRMGMPAVSTALITSKNEYNDDSPADDVMQVGDPAAPKWAGEIIDNLTSLHEALDDDLQDAGLTPCGEPGDASGCVQQEVASGVTVADLVVPDTITIDTTAEAGFPNGRMLPEPVMDVTLAVVLLDLNEHTPTTLAELPLNPTENDVSFPGSFPYLAEPHE